MGKIKILSVTKLKKFLIINKPLTFFLVLVAGLVFLTAVPYLKEVLGGIKPPSTVREYQIGSSSVSTTLPENQVREIVEFLRVVYEDSFWPPQFSLQRQEGVSQPSDEQHYGAWDNLGKIYSVLFVKGNSSSTKYLRTWVVAPAAELNEDKAVLLLSQSFRKEFLDRTGEVSCSDQSGSGEVGYKVCSALTNDSSGDKIGVLVHHPFKLQDGTEVTLVSACLFPREGELFASANICL